jgi:hypothetical protein
MALRYEIEDVALDVDRDRDEWIRFYKHTVYDHPIEHDGHEWTVESSPNQLMLTGRKMAFVTIFRLKRLIT